MLTIENRTTQIDDLLDKMAEELQLDAIRYNRMKTAYEAVKNWIEADEKFFKPFKYDVYPHGSVRILTTVKPIGKDEFDLDIAIHIITEWQRHTPARIYNELKRRLEENNVYRGMLEAKNRCIRLNYSGDFHMDILPGIQENQYDNNKLRVPDRELNDWVSSNPRGYAEWFLSKSNLVRVSLLEKAFTAENLPIDRFKDKKPLQRAVQLIKRYRDEYFLRDDRYKTSSIILTTIAGQYYQGADSIFDTVDGIVTTIKNMTAYPTRLKIYNPVNPDEDFTDKWDAEPTYYSEFKKFSLHLYDEWQALKKREGLITESRILKGLFGEQVFNSALISQTNFLEDVRKSNKLAINRESGLLSLIGTQSQNIKVPTNTFFGFK